MSIIYYDYDTEWFLVAEDLKQSDEESIIKLLQQTCKKFARVRVLDPGNEYDPLKKKAESWDKYCKWKEAREIYLKGKNTFEPKEG